MTPTDPTSNSRLTNFFTIRQQVKVEVNDGNHKVVNAYTGNVGKVMEKLFGYQKCTDNSVAKLFTSMGKGIGNLLGASSEELEKLLDQTDKKLDEVTNRQSFNDLDRKGNENAHEIAKFVEENKMLLSKKKDGDVVDNYVSATKDTRGAFLRLQDIKAKNETLTKLLTEIKEDFSKGRNPRQNIQTAQTLQSEIENDLEQYREVRQNADIEKFVNQQNQ